MASSGWSPMQRKGPDALTGTELNAAVYRYLQESGFVHTAFNFFYEADIGRGNIQGMIPQGALIRIVHKGLQYIEFEANSEIGSDDEHHVFDTLELMTNDLDELRKKITSSSKCNSVKDDKEKRIDCVETDKVQCSAETATVQPMKHAKAQGIVSKEQNIWSAEIGQHTGSAETTAMHRKKLMQKWKAAQNSNPGETAKIHRTQPMKHAKVQGMDSKEHICAETTQKTGSAETTTGQGLQLSWIGKKLRLKKWKH